MHRVYVWPESQGEPRNVVGSLSPTKNLRKFEQGTFRPIHNILTQQAIGHSPRTAWNLPTSWKSHIFKKWNMLERKWVTWGVGSKNIILGVKWSLNDPSMLPWAVAKYLNSMGPSAHKMVKHVYTFLKNLIVRASKFVLVDIKYSTVKTFFWPLRGREIINPFKPHVPFWFLPENIKSKVLRFYSL